MWSERTSNRSGLMMESLAAELAARARVLRDLVRDELEGEQRGERQGRLLELYQAFREVLIKDLSPDQFANLYAQTVIYGLFAARGRVRAGFSREVAFEHVPCTVGVVRDLLRVVLVEESSALLLGIVDDIVQVLGNADMAAMEAEIESEGKMVGLLEQFYETFLRYYDVGERVRRGVYYTPESVVSYIVRSVHTILKKRFDKGDGLASGNVTLLDPAAGTMSFIARAAEIAVGEFMKKYGAGDIESFIRNHVLRDFYGLEVMVAPYVIGHVKMALMVEEWGYELREGERVPLYLADTLDMEELEVPRLPDFSMLSEESKLAGWVKRRQSILVILGNPPYRVLSENKGEWITEQIRTYQWVDGKRVDEHSMGWLHDDYVKFLRFAQWKVEQAGYGVVGMVTNHGYLRNPTFRGMRRSLMETFDEIYVLDLHGNSIVRERAPNGMRDKNVFDIRVGVAIVLLVKSGEGKESQIYYADVWGGREEKYVWLEDHDVDNTLWRKIYPCSPLYLFSPMDDTKLEEYRRFPVVMEMFEKNWPGVITLREKLGVSWSPEEMWTLVLNFSHMDEETARRVYGLTGKISGERIRRAQRDVAEAVRENIVPVTFRPFDVRYTYHTNTPGGFYVRHRGEYARHMLMGENVAIAVGRQGQAVDDRKWCLIFCAEHMAEFHLFARSGAAHIPLYLYGEGRNLFNVSGIPERRSNVRETLLAALGDVYGQVPAPEEVFYYVYAVLHAPGYRKEYEEFLRVDYPRIPFADDWTVFKALAGCGERLLALHLLRSAELDVGEVCFEGGGEPCLVKRLSYDVGCERVYVNEGQYFGPVPDGVWGYRIGGYQVCKKWLRDRCGRELSDDETGVYCRIVVALGRTLEIQEKIDKIYGKMGKVCGIRGGGR